MCSKVVHFLFGGRKGSLETRIRYVIGRIPGDGQNGSFDHLQRIAKRKFTFSVVFLLVENLRHH